MVSVSQPGLLQGTNKELWPIFSHPLLFLPTRKTRLFPLFSDRKHIIVKALKQTSHIVEKQVFFKAFLKTPYKIQKENPSSI